VEIHATGILNGASLALRVALIELLEHLGRVEAKEAEERLLAVVRRLGAVLARLIAPLGGGCVEPLLLLLQFRTGII